MSSNNTSVFRPGLRRKRRSPGWLFVLPYTIMLAAFGIVPAAYAIFTSFVVTPVFGDAHFSLIQNFSDVLKDFRLPVALRNVGLYLLLWLPLMLVTVFSLALVMDAKRNKLAFLTRFVAYVPGAVTGAAAVVLWVFLLSPTVSPVRFLLQGFVQADGTIINNDTLAYVLALIALSTASGGWIVMVFGALTAIPKEIIEAARIDGANAWQLATQIKLPFVRSYIAFILIISFAAGFQVFAEPAVIEAANPGRVSTVWSLNQIIYSYATGEANFGRASALALMLLAVCLAVAIYVIKRTRFYSIDR